MKSKPRFSELLPASCCLTSLSTWSYNNGVSHQPPRHSHFHHHRHKKQAAAIPLVGCNPVGNAATAAAILSAASPEKELSQSSSTSTTTTAYDIIQSGSCGGEKVTSYHNNRSIRICCRRLRRSQHQPRMSQINHLAFHDKDFLTSSGYCLSSTSK